MQEGMDEREVGVALGWVSCKGQTAAAADKQSEINRKRKGRVTMGAEGQRKIDENDETKVDRERERV